MFLEPCDDPWYSAHRIEEYDSRLIYRSDDPVRVLGCLDQIQYCNPSLEPSLRCGPLAAFSRASDLSRPLWGTEQQRTIYDWHRNSSEAIPSQFLAWLGTLALTSQQLKLGSTQGKLPDNQWQLEVEHWFNSALARLQHQPLEVAIGPSNEEMRAFTRPPETPEERLLCQNIVGYLTSPLSLNQLANLGDVEDS